MENRLGLVLLALCTSLAPPGLIAPTLLSAQETEATRLSRVIDLLDGRDAVFGIISSDRSLNNARSLARSGLDFIIIDMEHGPWSPETLRVFLLGMTDRQRTAANGHLQMAVTPLVRVPQNGAEMMSSVVKQALDVGAFGVMFPMIENREQALNAVSSMRYPRPLGSDIREPRGRRGRSPGIASWFWGIGGGEYYRRADLWPLDPSGNLLAIIQGRESRRRREDRRNHHHAWRRRHLRRSIGSLDADGLRGQPRRARSGAGHPQTVLAACLRHDVPCAITTGAGSVEDRLSQGFRMVTVGGDGGITAGTSRALGLGRSAAGRK